MVQKESEEKEDRRAPGKGTKGKGKEREAMGSTNEAEEFIKDLRLAKRVAPYFCKFVVSCFI